MPYLFEILLFLAPLGVFLLWRRFNPRLAEVDPRLAPLAFAGLVLALGATIWFGFLGRRDPGAVYVPAELGADGRVQAGHTDPPR